MTRPIIAHRRTLADFRALRAPTAGRPLLGDLLRHGDVAVAQGPHTDLVTRSLGVHLAAGAPSWAGYDLPGSREKVVIADRRYDQAIGSSLRSIGLATGLDPAPLLLVSRVMLNLDGAQTPTGLVNDAREGVGNPAVLIIDDLGASLGRLDPATPTGAAETLEALVDIQDRLGGCALVVLTAGEFLPGLADVTINTHRDGQRLEVTAARTGEPSHTFTFHLVTARGVPVPMAILTDNAS